MVIDLGGTHELDLNEVTCLTGILAAVDAEPLNPDPMPASDDSS
ncbi:MAG: hypothetical protein ACXV5Q_06120 [Frankiaceae bacterium]